MFIKLFILSLLLAGVAFAFLGVRMLLKRGSSFPDTHVGHNKEMQTRGITCAKSTDTGCVPSASFKGCAGCSEA